MKLSKIEAEQISEIADRFGIKLLIAFGSAVRGEMHAKSDLDIGLLMKNSEVSLKELCLIEHELQQLLPRQKLDLSILNHADPLFLKKIMESPFLLYGRTSDFQRFKIYAFKRYQDHRRFLELERAYAERFIQKITVPS